MKSVYMKLILMIKDESYSVHFVPLNIIMKLSDSKKFISQQQNEISNNILHVTFTDMLQIWEFFLWIFVQFRVISETGFLTWCR